jgi:hypothetical protein
VRLKLKTRQVALLGVVAVAAVVALWPRFQSPGAKPTARARAQRQEKVAPIPRIDLARLEKPRTEAEVGRRDLFVFGPLTSRAEAAPPTDLDPAPIEAPPPPPTSAGAGRGAASQAGLPPMNLKFIGSVGNDAGVSVAVLVTERNEVLTGQPGEVVANRYRIERIGIESVDLEDVGTGQSRRLPLKGN